MARRKAQGGTRRAQRSTTYGAEAWNSLTPPSASVSAASTSSFAWDGGNYRAKLPDSGGRRLPLALATRIRGPLRVAEAEAAAVGALTAVLAMQDDTSVLVYLQLSASSMEP